ncbi:type II toxin-antitoxin system HicA family toxin [Lutispora sp.]|uniref:type II toxin-antitoxin system HicA family toxin n=1 Tax=Lutispora sp. TaxID=2828727 RepID=UPI002B21AF9B|nr:type II toxin-antitoxin system HicA family toxin [Lutispora sp.]MEA4963328.1 type II toxin-antitoxin system HicA family toxin [Lutispora sp.]
MLRKRLWLYENPWRRFRSRSHQDINEVTKQTGSHIRLTSMLNGEHHITIPNHDPVKVGALNSIINDIENHKKIDKMTLINELFK